MPVFLDGNPTSTSYPDFRRWTLQLTDPSDTDGDGVPDLSDSTPAGPPPVVLTNPIGATRTVGQSVTFTIAASGSGPLTYQWYRDGLPITGGNATSYTLPTVKLTDAGTYTAGVRNAAGSVTSTAATLTVNPAVPRPVVLTQPVAATRTVGQPVTFTIAASGSGSLTYQWYLDGIPIAGANAPSYTLAAVALTDAGAYTAGVRNTAGEVLSNPAVLTVNLATAPKLTLKREINGRLTFTWTGAAKLMWAPNLSGPFNLVPGAVSGYQALPGTGSGFYRLEP